MIEENEGGGSAPNKLVLLGRIPWTFLIIIFASIVYAIPKVDFMVGPIGTVLTLVFIVMGVVVLMIQFFKSADISTMAFIAHQCFSVLAIILATILMTLMKTKKMDMTPTTETIYWIGCLILLADVILSPINSFRTAKRNLQMGT